MNYSGIAVMTTPDRVDALRQDIEALDWAEVAHWAEDGRLVVVIEGEDIGEEVRRLKVLKDLPGVMSAEMVMQYCGEESMTPADVAETLNYLNAEEGTEGQLSYYQRLKRLSTR